MSLLRIGGIASGFDTEQIIRDLMRVEQMKADKLYQNKQVLEWKKEDFRGIINKVRAFRDTYFDILNTQTNLMSPAALKKIAVESSDTSIVTVVATSGAAPGALDFKVLQSAAAAKGASEGGVSLIRSSAALTSPLAITEGKNVINVTLNGKTKEIAVSPGEEGHTYTLAELGGELQTKLNAAFGVNRITVAASDGLLSFETEYSSDMLTLVSNKMPDGEDVLSVLNIGNGAANRLLLNDNLEAVSAKLAKGPLAFEESGENGSGFLKFEVNNVSITVEKTDSLEDLLAKINNSGAGVLAEYNTSSDTLSITAQEVGYFRISTDENGCALFKAFGIKVDVDEDAGNEGIEKYYIGEAGREAVFTINAVEHSRPGNIFTIDGLTYSIQKTVKQGEGEQSPAVKISLNLDVEAIAQNIEGFVKGYNELIDEINSKLREEVYRDFSPLTIEQKENMKEKEIEMWEDKARSGLLRRESSLENMLREMRTALYTAVDGMHLVDIGLETSNDYREQGKLVLKGGGSALRAALAEDPDKVIALFTRRPDIDYSPDLSGEKRQDRFKEAGLAHRLSDILNDYIRTLRDAGGKKGILLERAGIEGDVSEFRNFFDREIEEINKRIERVNAALLRKEEQYYRQFTAMEKALQQLYSQGDWLTQQIMQFQALR